MLYGSLNFIVAASAVIFFAWLVGLGVRKSGLSHPFNIVAEYGLYGLSGALLLYMAIGTFGEALFMRLFQ